MKQEKSIKNNDTTGLYNVLKNIQSRKCSDNFLCIELGTIYGDFDSLLPKNITIQTTQVKDVHTIIKPIIITNNTSNNSCNPIYPVPTNNQSDDNYTNSTDLFEQESDCEDLNMSGNIGLARSSSQINLLNSNFNRFKQIDNNINEMKRFYRKVSVSNEIYSTDIFKQGLNIIILERDIKYSKCK